MKVLCPVVQARDNMQTDTQADRAGNITSTANAGGKDGDNVFPSP